MLTCLIEQFHRKIGAAIGEPFKQQYVSPVVVTAIEQLVKEMELTAQHLEQSKSLIAQRAHLKIEECAEFLHALLTKDEVLLFDAICDDAYVGIGTAVAFDLPFEAGFVEVHRSNMSKEPQMTDPAKHRVRDKGPNYSPPDLITILERHRKKWKL